MYFKRTLTDHHGNDWMPFHLGFILRHYCSSFLPEHDPPGLHLFLESKFTDDGYNHHCIFWPCKLFDTCPTTNNPSLHIYDHWHCTYADCPMFNNFFHRPPYLLGTGILNITLEIYNELTLSAPIEPLPILHDDDLKFL